MSRSAASSMAAVAASSPPGPSSPTAASSSPRVTRGLETSRSGWLEKYSVGRGIFPVKNWQRRYFTVTHSGLNYAKNKDVACESRTYIPFVLEGNSMYEVRLSPVFLLPTVTAAIHPEANDPGFFYFGIHFEEKGKNHILLLRTASGSDKEEWVRFIGQFIHVGTMHGVPNMHPLDPSSPRVFDPEELDPTEKRALRRTVIDWDEGQDLRARYGAVPCEADVEELYLDDGGGGMMGAGVGATGSHSASAAHTPRGGVHLVAGLDMDDDMDMMGDHGGRSAAPASNRSHPGRSPAASGVAPAKSPPPPPPKDTYDVL